MPFCPDTHFILPPSVDKICTQEPHWSYVGLPAFQRDSCDSMDLRQQFWGGTQGLSPRLDKIITSPRDLQQSHFHAIAHHSVWERPAENPRLGVSERTSQVCPGSLGSHAQVWPRHSPAQGRWAPSRSPTVGGGLTRLLQPNLVILELQHINLGGCPQKGMSRGSNVQVQGAVPDVTQLM